MKKQNRFIQITLLFFLAITAFSCLKDDENDKRKEEKRTIENYVQVNNITSTPSSTGLYYISEVEGTGATPTETDFALITYKATDLEGKFYDGTDKALAELNKVYPYFALGGPLKVYAGKNSFLPGVTEGIRMMKEGGKAKLIMPSALAYDDYIPRIIEVELLKVIPNPKAYELQQTANFLDTAFHKTLADSTGAGIFYIEKVAGTGIAPSTGKIATIKYKGYLLDGRVFDKTETDPFKFSLGSGSVITGLDEGIRLMKKGGTATFVIPYYRAYGFNPVPNKRSQQIIPFFSTLVFDVELTDVTDN